MTRFDLLSRASAFAVTAQRAPGTAVHIVAAMHVPCPYLFPNYYPPTEYPWLAEVKDTHVRSRVEFRKRGTGQMVASFALKPGIWAHHARDLCVMHLEDEKGFVDACAKHGLEATSLVPAAGLEVGAALDFHGHVLPDFPVSADDEGLQVPRVVAGTFELSSPQQWFAGTEEVLAMGMCGGPVLREDGKCVGMLEGIVPDHPEPETLSPEHRRVLKHAAFAPAEEIVDLLHAVEERMVADAAAEPADERERERMLSADDLPDWAKAGNGTGDK